MKIGIFGGTFDPIHAGHILIADEACRRLSLDELLFVPVYVPPHKMGSIAADRRNHVKKMIELTIEGQDRFRIDDVEIRRKGISYTVDTVEELSARYDKETEFYLIIGRDQFNEFASWKNYTRILELSSVAVISRKTKDGMETGSGFKPSGDLKNRFVFIDNIDCPVSSTRIRELVRKGRPFMHLVHPAVAKYIATYGLYRK